VSGTTQNTIASPAFARAWQYLQDLLNEMAAGEPEGREALEVIEQAVSAAMARTAEDERRDVLAYLRGMGRVGVPPLAVADFIERGDHEGAASR
jgi:hypothetical protein